MTPSLATVKFCLCEQSVPAHSWLSLLYVCVCVVIIQVAVDDRLKLLQEAHRDFGPSSQHFLSSEYRANYFSKEIRNLGWLGLIPLSYTVSHRPISLPCPVFSSSAICFAVTDAQWTRARAYTYRADAPLHSWIMQGLITALHWLLPLPPSLEWSLAEHRELETKLERKDKCRSVNIKQSSQTPVPCASVALSLPPSLPLWLSSFSIIIQPLVFSPFHLICFAGCQTRRQNGRCAIQSRWQAQPACCVTNRHEFTK